MNKGGRVFKKECIALEIKLLMLKGNLDVVYSDSYQMYQLIFNKCFFYIL